MDDLELDELILSLGHIALHGDRGNPSKLRAEIRAEIVSRVGPPAQYLADGGPSIEAGHPDDFVEPKP